MGWRPSRRGDHRSWITSDAELPPTTAPSRPCPITKESSQLVAGVFSHKRLGITANQDFGNASEDTEGVKSSKERMMGVMVRPGNTIHTFTALVYKIGDYIAIPRHQHSADSMYGLKQILTRHEVRQCKVSSKISLSGRRPTIHRSWLLLSDIEACMTRWA